MSKSYWDNRELFSKELFANANLRFRLRIVLVRCLKIQPQTAKKFIFDMKGKSDQDILSEIKDIISQKPISVPKEDKFLVKANKGSLLKIFQDLGIDQKILSDIPQARYLDIGVGEGINTLAIGEILGLPLNQTFGLDIKQFEKNRIPEITKIYDGINFPFPDNHFDFITIFQVLHHVNTEENHIKKYIKEISRVLKPGGHLLLKEHDCDTLTTKKLINLEHILYDIKNREPISEPNCLMSKKKWFDILRENGLIKKGKDSFYKNDPTRSFFSYFILDPGKCLKNNKFVL